MFRNEVLFYREVAPVVGVRVPACYRADDTETGTVLELEDLSAWDAGADPAVAASLLARMHSRWEGRAATRWPWLRPVCAGDDLVARLYDQTWPGLASRPGLTASVLAFGESVHGRVTEAERAIATAGPLTLVHGDASTQNMRTGPDGEVALLDWEDVSYMPGVLDLAWLLVSSTEPARWDEVTAAYGRHDGLLQVLPSVLVQGLFSLADAPAGTPEATAWTQRLDAACHRLRSAA
jgi:Ser/Thr protein kinase RdoA (MazF antagonist)